MGNTNCVMISILHNSINDVFRIHNSYITAVPRSCSGMAGKVHFLLNLPWGIIWLIPITLHWTQWQCLLTIKSFKWRNRLVARWSIAPAGLRKALVTCPIIWTENIQWCEGTKVLFFHMYNLRNPNSLFLYKDVRAEISIPTPPPPHLNGAISESGRHTCGHIPFFSYCIAKH